MSMFMQLVKERKIGRLCKSGAWIIAMIGTARIIVELSSLWNVYQYFVSQQADQISQDQGPLNTFNSYIIPALSSVLQDTATLVFYFLVLYAAGIIIDSLSSPAKSDITIEPIEQKDISLDDLNRV